LDTHKRGLKVPKNKKKGTDVFEETNKTKRKKREKDENRRAGALLMKKVKRNWRGTKWGRMDKYHPGENERKGKDEKP